MILCLLVYALGAYLFRRFLIAKLLSKESSSLDFPDDCLDAYSAHASKPGAVPQ